MSISLGDLRICHARIDFQICSIYIRGCVIVFMTIKLMILANITTLHVQSCYKNSESQFAKNYNNIYAAVCML